MNPSKEHGAMADFDHLEQRLRSDPGGDVARELIAYFSQIAVGIEALLCTGLSQVEREVTMKMLQGVWAAERIIQQVWESFHQAALAREAQP